MSSKHKQKNFIPCCFNWPWPHSG